MENLKILYGLNEAGELISAELAGKDTGYSCPCCGIKLVLRSGEVRVKHFAHPPSSGCSLESVLHITAKKLIRTTIDKNAKGEQEISLENHCQNCGVVFSISLPMKTFSSAGLEVKVGDYICDVVGYRGDSIGLAIEILNTHEVDAIKAANLQAFWVELKAEDVLKNPEKWVPTQANLKDSYCAGCKKHINHVLEVADKFGVDRSLYTPLKNPAKATYIADIETCFKCKQEIPVFWWRGVPFCEVEPPNPKPKTIKFRNSKQYGGSYWANTCANCNMIQGDNYLYIFDNAPFKGLPLSTDAQASQGGVRVASSKSAVSEFMKVINRNF
ncbi:competence protein CoiA family protein [Pseudoalteromonas sp. T1lg22]|uniref:competence protein CoiA family protein n=1 Tax=Pseudoalteromonas sp. T1lg22 TaxID=2077096 RepID=UPI000CF5FC5F|nr:competence protein CoiA family protein [Pseudoalteromonas sp. T1lg22]